MLQGIRDRAQGWLAGIIVTLIIIPFALWGVNEYFNIAGNVSVAEVDGEEVSLQEFQRAYQQYRQQLQGVMGANFNINQLNEENLKQQTLNQMIEAKLLHQLSLRAGFRIGDEQIASTIHSLDSFQREGSFAQDLYERQLQAMGFSPIAFEERLRLDMLNEQLQQAIVNSLFVVPQELERITRTKGQKRDIAYVVFSAEPIKSSIQVTDEEIEKYYNEHPNDFMTPEQVKIGYLDLSLDERAKQVTVDDQALKSYYESHLTNYTVAEQRSASYIVVQVPKEEVNEEVVEAARKEAAGLVERARHGESFEQLAKESAGEGKAKREAGETGLLSKGVMEPAFDEALFSMKPGEISDPIRTPFGFQVIQLKQIKEGGTKSFAEARAEIEQAYRREQAERVFFEQAEQLATVSFENPDTLEVASKTLGLEIKESGYFSRAGDNADPLLANPKIIEAAFSPEMLEEGGNSEPLELGDDRLVVLRVKEHKPAERRKLEEVRNEIGDRIKSERAKSATAERGQRLLERLNSGEDRMALAKQEGFEWQEAKGITQEAENINRAILRTAFKLGRVAEGKPLYGSVPIGTGDHALVAILAVQDADPKAVDEKLQKETRDHLLRSLSANEWRDFVAQLRNHATIQIYSDKL
jgi:peptidyl-prolyl cis-trans isomerase D